MNIENFLKLPASDAGSLYRRHRDAGDAEEASRLHQAYYEAHRLRLSDDRQIAEVQAPVTVTAGVARPAAAARKNERSKVRRVGIVLSCVGAVIFTFAAAAGIGAAGLIIGGSLASCGFILWLVGVLEDRLIALQYALEGLPSQ